MNKMNKLMIATLASMLFLAMVPAAWAAGTADGNTPDWQSMSAEDLLWAAQNLTGDDPAVAAARQSLISTVTSKYLSAGSVKSLTLGQWESLSGSLVSSLSEQAKAQWAAAITQAYAGSGETAVSLTAGDAEQLTSILNRLGAKDLAVSTVARLAKNSNAVQSMSFPDLIWVLGNLTGDAPAIKAGKQNIADLVTTKFLADPAAIRSIPCSQWEDLISCLTADMAVEQCSQWAGKIRAAYVQDATGLASLKQYSDLDRLINALSRLGEKQDDVNGIAATFVKSTTLWQSWPPGEVTGLATRIGALGELGATVRQSLITLATSKYVSAGSGKSLTLGHWETLTGALAPGLSKEAKGQWAATIIQAYAGSGDTIGALTARDVEQLLAALGRLDAGDLAVDTVAKLVNDSTAWQNWNLDSQQARLIGTLTAPDKRESTKPARLKILERMTATYIPTAEEARKVPLKQWASLVMGLYDVMPEETSTLWAERLRGVFDNATLAGLANDAEQRNALLPAIAILDDKMKTGLALSWLKDRTLWQGAPIEALAALALAAYRDNRDEALPILDDLDKFCVARHATKPLTLDECLALRGMYVSAGQRPKAQQWVLVGCDVTIGTEALRAAADQATVVSLSLALVDTAMVGPEKDCSKLAATVAAVASKGGLALSAAWQPRCLSEALCSPEAHQIVRDALMDSAGNPWPFISDTLSWAYVSSGKFKDWAAYLDDQIARAPDGSDKKLLWQIARAHAEAARFRTYSALAGRKWLDDALASTKEPRQRFVVVEELARGYMATGNYDKGISELKELAESFAGTEFAPAIVKFQASLQGARDKEQVAKTRAAEEARRMHVKELQRRLAEAKEKKDAEAIQRLERLLGVEEQ
jgi:hypothetical protein